jgi:hypothetical protein
MSDDARLQKFVTSVNLRGKTFSVSQSGPVLETIPASAQAEYRPNKITQRPAESRTGWTFRRNLLRCRQLIPCLASYHETMSVPSQVGSSDTGRSPTVARKWIDRTLHRTVLMSCLTNQGPSDRATAYCLLYLCHTATDEGPSEPFSLWY